MSGKSDNSKKDPESLDLQVLLDGIMRVGVARAEDVVQMRSALMEEEGEDIKTKHRVLLECGFREEWRISRERNLVAALSEQLAEVSARSRPGMPRSQLTKNEIFASQLKESILAMQDVALETATSDSVVQNARSSMKTRKGGRRTNSNSRMGSRREGGGHGKEKSVSDSVTPIYVLQRCLDESRRHFEDYYFSLMRNSEELQASAREDNTQREQLLNFFGNALPDQDLLPESAELSQPVSSLSSAVLRSSSFSEADGNDYNDHEGQGDRSYSYAASDRSSEDVSVHPETGRTQTTQRERRVVEASAATTSRDTQRSKLHASAKKARSRTMPPKDTAAPSARGRPSERGETTDDVTALQLKIQQAKDSRLKNQAAFVLLRGLVPHLRQRAQLQRWRWRRMSGATRKIQLWWRQRWYYRRFFAPPVQLSVDIPQKLVVRLQACLRRRWVLTSVLPWQRRTVIMARKRRNDAEWRWRLQSMRCTLSEDLKGLLEYTSCLERNAAWRSANVGEEKAMHSAFKAWESGVMKKAKKGPLPVNWVMQRDSLSRDEYFLNIASGEVSAERPGVKAARAFVDKEKLRATESFEAMKRQKAEELGEMEAASQFYMSSYLLLSRLQRFRIFAWGLPAVTLADIRRAFTGCDNMSSQEAASIRFLLFDDPQLDHVMHYKFPSSKHP
jgi:hypothetical protein